MTIDCADSVALGYAVVAPNEAERFIQNLQMMELADIGSKRWSTQHQYLEKLNLQAHDCAQKNADNFVVEELVTYDKMKGLIHDLLVIEAWKEFVFPNLSSTTISNSSMRIYFIMYHEATIFNLLEVALYHEHVVESCGDELLELVDYCMRKLAWLVALSPHDRSSLHNPVQIGKEPTRAEELDRQQRQLQFQCAVISVGILRFMTEHAPVLPLSVLNRMLNTHDLILAIVPLIDNPPWTYRSVPKDTEQPIKWWKYIEHKWKVVPAEELLVLTKTEAQAWLILYYIVCSQECRERYEFTTFRKSQLLCIRKYVNELLIDQLPVLTSVQRFLDELTLMETPDISRSATNSLILESVPVIRESLLAKKKWQEYTREHERQVFDKLTKQENEQDMKDFAAIYNIDGIEDLYGEPPLPPDRTLEPVQVELRITEHKTICRRIKLVVDKASKMPQKTKQGLYARYTLEPEEEAALCDSLPWNCIVEAVILYEDKSSHTIVSEELNLPNLPAQELQEHNVVQMDDWGKTFPLKLWRQAGTLDSGSGIVQIQAVRQEQIPNECNDTGYLNCYRLGKLFLSVPSIDEK